MVASTNTKHTHSQTNLRRFHKALARWYGAHGRHALPWRNTDDPYAIWVSEVMLQQTQVSTVLARYYFPFLKTFPTITHLANASRTEVLKAWEGLGYYRRAGFLHEAAQRAVSEGGLNPLRANALTPAASGARNYGATQLLNDLLALPGIGKNTAHAILAFAHHQPVPVLEANVKRVIARIFALATPADATLWEKAGALLDKKNPFGYNQAMMDLGAMVCTPREPRCGICPAHSICAGKAKPEAYPARKAKKQVPTRHVIITMTEDAAGKLFLEARKDALLGGLYGFPQVPVIAGRARPDVVIHLKKKKGGLLRRARNDELTIGTVTHTYSHFKLVGTVRYRKLPAVKRSAGWHTREEIATLPLSRLDHKVLALLTAPRKQAA